MSEAPSTVSLIIPNWNGIEHLPTCLDSIERQSLHPAETIVVDNGSTDGSVPFIEQHYPWVSVTRLEANAGFARAVNHGIHSSHGELVAIINNDVELDPQWVETMVSAIESDPKAGSAACRMLNYFDRGRIDAAGDGLTPFAAPYTRGHGMPDQECFRMREYVFGACAGAALYRRAVFDTVGMFDEDFVSYYEDIDLAFRAQLAGFATLYVPEAVCYHKRNATADRIAHYPLRMQGRNYLMFILKNVPLRLLVPRIPFMVVSRLLWLLKAARNGALSPAARGLVEGFGLIPVSLRKRRAIQKSRTVPVSSIRSFMHR